MVWFLLACSRSADQWLNPDQASLTSAELLEGSPVDRVVYAALMFLGLIVLVRRGAKVLGILRQSWPILFFFAFCLVSLVWSDYPLVALKRWNKAIGDLVMVLIVWTDPQPVNALKRLFARTTYILIPMSVLLIKYYPALGRTYGRYLGEVHYTGVTTNKNSLGAICLLFGLASVWRLLSLLRDDPKSRQRTRQIAAQAVILGTIGWLFSIVDSMTSLSCLLLALCLLLATCFRAFTRSRWMVHGLIAIIVLIPALVLFVGMNQNVLEDLGRDSTLTDRTRMWSMVIDLTHNRWLGTGYESFWLGPRLDAMTSAFKWVPNEAHNGYIEIYANLGWVGLAFLTVVLVHGYQRVTRGWSRNLPTSSLMMAYFVVGVIYNFTEAGYFRMMAPVWMFFLLAVTAVRQVASVVTDVSPEESIDFNEADGPCPELVGASEESFETV